MFQKLFAAALLSTLPVWAAASPVGVDGVIGAEWAGVTATHVVYDSTAPINNFANPTNKSNNVGYDIYMRRDSNYLYAGLKTTGPAVNSTLIFANLYFATVYGSGPSASGIGFQVTNDKAFDVSNNTLFSDTADNLIQSAVFTGTLADDDVIEVAIDLSVFRTNALGVSNFLGMPADQEPLGILMFMAQSFGYSAAGGNANYGLTQLGFVEVPEPGSLALAGFALAGLFATSRRNRR